MPPKGKKKGGKKSGKKEASKDEEEPVDSGIPEELDKERVVGDIKDWERRLRRYEEKYKQLKQLYDQLMSAYDDSSKTRVESVSFLKKKMEQFDDEIAELRDRLLGQRQLKEQQKEECEQRLQKLRTDFQEMKDQLTSENNLAATKLASLEEFKRDKDAINARYKALADEFQQLLDDHQAVKERIEEKNLLDRDRLKKDMVTRVNNVAAEFRKVSNRQMADTTKRTIRENVSIQSQLLKMSEKEIELAEENAELRKRLRQLRRQIGDLESAQKEAATRNACHLRIVEMLRHKRKEIDLILDEFRRMEKQMLAVQAQSEILRDQVEQQREEIESLAQQLEEGEEARQEVEQQLHAAAGDNEQARACVQEAASLLKLALQQPAGEADGDRLLRQLRQLLTDAVAELTGQRSGAAADGYDDQAVASGSSYSNVNSRPITAVTGTTEEDVPLNEELLKRAGSAKAAGAGAGKQDSSSLPDIGVASHCKPGALQLVPTARQRIPTFKEKVAASAARRTDAAANLPPAALQAFLLRQQHQELEQQQQRQQQSRPVSKKQQQLLLSASTKRTGTAGSNNDNNNNSVSGRNANNGLFQLL